MAPLRQGDGYECECECVAELTVQSLVDVCPGTSLKRAKDGRERTTEHGGGVYEERWRGGTGRDIKTASINLLICPVRRGWVVSRLDPCTCTH